ncbi:aspartate carbamoyltransferase regulatory subunit, partial [Klebsiella pneumoniae]
NTIDHFKVVQKRHLNLPDEIAEVFRCPNTNCASHGEPVKSRFYVKKHNGQTRLKCHYCEKTYSRDSVAEA